MRQLWIWILTRWICSKCADAVIRLRGEYLYKYQPQHDISFNFTNGFPALWNKWKEGYRIQVSGNRCNWVKSSKADDSYEQFRKYLLDVFMYAGTLSLDKELPTKNIMDLAIGDVFIQGGSPGHAVIVVDMAVNEGGKKVYLLAQSYMPAQDTQVLTNPMDDYLSPGMNLLPVQSTLLNGLLRIQIYTAGNNYFVAIINA